MAAAETLTTTAADPKHLGARTGLTVVLHTWVSALTHHRQVHGIVLGGGLSPDGSRWNPCKPGFFLPCACNDGRGDGVIGISALPSSREPAEAPPRELGEPLPRRRAVLALRAMRGCGRNL
jgi:hypothetical protein